MGIENPERLTKWFTTIAKLEFWETYKFSELYQFFDEANKVLKNKQASLEQNKESAKEQAAETVTENGAVAIAEADEGLNSLIDQIETDTTESVADLSFEEYAKRYHLYAYLTPSYVQQNGQMYPAEVARVGSAAIKDTARINNMLRQAENIFPRDLKFAWTAKPEPSMTGVLELVALKANVRDGGPALGGDVIEDARQVSL